MILLAHFIVLKYADIINNFAQKIFRQENKKHEKCTRSIGFYQGQ